MATGMTRLNERGQVWNIDVLGILKGEYVTFKSVMKIPKWMCVGVFSHVLIPINILVTISDQCQK